MHRDLQGVYSEVLMMMWSKPIKHLVNRGYTSQQGSEPDKPAEPSGFEPGSDMVHLAQV